MANIFIDEETAKEMVIKIAPNASEPMLTIELQVTKGDNYRPYAVAAKFLMLDYRRITKADEVTFNYNTDAIRALLNLQKSFDLEDENIPDGQTVDDLLESLCATCETETYGIGVNVY